MNSASPAADGGRRIPSVLIESLNGGPLDTASFGNGGKPFVVTLWASWCRDCRAALDAIAAQYARWNADYGTVVFAVAIDDTSSQRDVAGVVAAHGWPYAIGLDPNQDFKRALGVVAVPYLCIADGSGALVYSHASYAPGDEEYWGYQLKRLAG